MLSQLKFANAIQRARLEKNLTQEEIAQMISVSPHWYQSIENGDVMPNGELILKLIAFLEIDGMTFRETESEND